MHAPRQSGAQSDNNMRIQYCNILVKFLYFKYLMEVKYALTKIYSSRKQLQDSRLNLTLLKIVYIKLALLIN